MGRLAGINQIDAEPWPWRYRTCWRVDRTYRANKRMWADIQKHIVWLDRVIAHLEKEIDDQIKASPIRHEKATLLGDVKFGGRSNVAFGDHRRA